MDSVDAQMCSGRGMHLKTYSDSHGWNYRGTGKSLVAQMCTGRGMHLKTYSDSHGCEVFRVTSVCHHGHVRVMRREVW